MIFGLISLLVLVSAGRSLGTQMSARLGQWHIILGVVVVSGALSMGSTALAQSDASSLRIDKLRLWHSPNSTRVVFDVSADVKHNVFSLSKPNRIVVDIDDSSLLAKLPAIDPNNAHIANIRTGKPRKGVLRFVFELKKTLKPQSFVLSPNELYGHRLVLDLQDPLAADDSSAVAAPDSTVGLSNNSSLAVPSQIAKDQTAPAPQSATSSIDRQIVVPQPPQQNRQLVVAIDAGHGGEDPGAIGYRGSHEKKITLAISQRLKKVIDADPNMRATLVRSGDYYIKLHKRRLTARDQGADIFVSIHADAFRKRSARGFSVFALSQRGATSAMASTLAAKENASDSIGGVSLANKDEVLAKVLVDLSMTNTISESVSLGGRVLKELSKLGRLHSSRVEQAGFAVLKTPDMPSILVETGFITNPEEERNLRSSSYQQKIAVAIHSAIDQHVRQTPYFNKGNYASPNVARTGAASSSTGSASQYHKIVRGDSLSKIAQRYGVSLRALKQENNLRSNTAVLGRRLKIPGNAKTIVSQSSRSKPAVHVVKRGDSLSKIAQRYGVSLKALKQENNLRSNTAVLGRRLKIPGSAKAGVSQSSQSRPAVHVVKRGESLSKISARYNITINALKKHNGLKKDTVVLGQRIKLPGGTTAANKSSAKPVTHKVRRGDTLSEIAEKYRSSINAIMRANNLRSRTIQLGQVLKIPS